MNNNSYEISFSELRCKEVVNAADGRRLGRIVDIVFSGENGKIKGIVTPAVKRSVFSKSQELFIPWRCVEKLGEDVIIVNIGSNDNGADECDNDKDRPHQKPYCKPKDEEKGPACDKQCEKCMLFDCERRWKTG